MTPMRLVIGVCIGILATATLLAQVPPPAQDTPTFRSGVQLIDVDVVVTDKDGNPVKDLTRDDFEIIEHGRPQEVRTFTLIDLPIEPLSVLAARRAEVESDVVTNTQPEGRTYVLLLDTADTDLRARHVTERWLDEVVQPSDRVAIVHARGSTASSQAFTSSRRLLLNGINRMIRSAADAVATANQTTRQLDTLQAIEDISERLGTIPGRRKAIVWITRNPPILHPQPNSRFSMDGAVILLAWQKAARAAVNNNVAVYPVDTNGLTTSLGINSLIHTASIREVAEETGGVAVGANSNDFSRGFATIVQDASSYYLLGYSPEPAQTDGEFHSISVRVRRPDVNVRARRGYYAAPPDAALTPSRPLPLPPSGVSVAAREALRRPVPVRGLGIDVTTTPFKGGGAKDSSVVIAAHVRGQTLDVTAGRRLAVSYQVFDVNGKVVTGAYKVFGFNLGSESKAQVSVTGLQFVERVTLPRGRYELRLVAEQPGGPIGSVLTTIEASEFDESLAISGVAIASMRANEVPLAGDPSLRSVLPDDATALRTFRAADGLSAYAEVYTRLDDINPGLRYDVINVAALTSAITNSAGAVVGRGKAQKVTGEPAGKSLREGFRTDFDLSTLTPGSYVLTLEASAGRDGKRTATRQIPFTVE